MWTPLRGTKSVSSGKVRQEEEDKESGVVGEGEDLGVGAYLGVGEGGSNSNRGNEDRRGAGGSSLALLGAREETRPLSLSQLRRSLSKPQKRVKSRPLRRKSSKKGGGKRSEKKKKKISPKPIKRSAAVKRKTKSSKGSTKPGVKKRVKKGTQLKGAIF